MASSDFSDGNCGIVGVERVAERRQAYYGAGTAFFREAVEDGKILDSVFLRLAAFFDFDRVENAVFINDQVYFRPVTVAIVEETTANVESRVAVFFDEFRYDVRLKERARRRRVFKRSRVVPKTEIASESAVHEVRFGTLDDPFDRIPRIRLEKEDNSRRYEKRKPTFGGIRINPDVSSKVA